MRERGGPAYAPPPSWNRRTGVLPGSRSANKREREGQEKKYFSCPSRDCRQPGHRLLKLTARSYPPDFACILVCFGPHMDKVDKFAGANTHVNLQIVFQDTRVVMEIGQGGDVSIRSIRPRRMANSSRMGDWTQIVLLVLVASACACSPTSAFIPIFRMQDKWGLLSRSSARARCNPRLPIPTRPCPSYFRSRREQTIQHLSSTWNQAPLPDDEQGNARAEERVPQFVPGERGGGGFPRTPSGGYV